MKWAGGKEQEWVVLVLWCQALMCASSPAPHRVIKHLRRCSSCTRALRLDCLGRIGCRVGIANAGLALAVLHSLLFGVESCSTSFDIY